MTTPRTHVDAALQQLGHRLKFDALVDSLRPALEPAQQGRDESLRVY